MKINGKEDEMSEAFIMQHENASSTRQLSKSTISNTRKFRKLLKCVFIAIIIYLLIGLLSRKEVINALSGNFNSNQPYLVYADESENNDSINNNKCNPFISNFTPFQINLNNVQYPRLTPLHLNKGINFTCLNSDSTIKKIFFWNAFFDKKDFSYGIGFKTPFEMHNCPVTNCELINNKSRLVESDLVLFHMRDIMDDLPSSRPRYQRWVFVLYESPVHARDFTELNGIFNYTSTYEIDSDFPGFYESYSNMRWEKNDKFDANNLDYFDKKKNFAVAVISNCGGTSKRLEYISELQNYIQISIFGKCGSPCPSVSSFEPKSTSCKEIVAYEYKFYFAFENSVCKDYVTEKFFQILRYPIIPVVLGGGFYEYYVILLNFLLFLHYNLLNKLIYLDSEIRFHKCT
jgi:hypothetical protein